MPFSKIKKIHTKFLVPILLLQLIALGTLGFIGYQFGSDMMKIRSERMFKARIDTAYSSIENEITDRLLKIEQLTSNPVFIKFLAAYHYKSEAETEVFNFQKGNGLILGEPEIGDLVNYSVGLLANEGNKKIIQQGLFPSVEYVGLDGFVKLHVYLGGSNDADFESADQTKLDRKNREWLKTAESGNVYVGKPEKIKLYLRKYDPVTFENIEVATEEELIPIAIPHKIENEVRGIFIITTTPNFISKALGGINVPDFLLVLLDGNDDKIAELGNANLEQNLPDNFLKHIRREPEGIISNFDNYISMHQILPSSNWCILIAGDRSAIYSSVYALRRNIVTVMFVSMAVMAAIIFAIIRKLLTPIVSLTKASNRIAMGDLGVVIEKESDDELGHLTESFNHMSIRTKEMTDELEQKNLRLSRINFVRRQLLSIISHELRTPLNSVVNFFDMLKEEVEPHRNDKSETFSGEFYELVDYLGKSIERSKVLVERLTHASSVIAGEIKSEDEPSESSSLKDIVSITCESIKEHIKEREIKIVYSKDVDASVACPGNVLKLMIEEALSNAIKFSPDKGVITVTAFAGEKTAGITIKDNGPGIPKDYIEDVIEPFFEIQDANHHTTGRFKTGAGGFGLGLTIIINLLRQYRGMLDIAAPENGGTSITITLPIL